MANEIFLTWEGETEKGNEIFEIDKKSIEELTGKDLIYFKIRIKQNYKLYSLPVITFMSIINKNKKSLKNQDCWIIININSMETEGVFLSEQEAKKAFQSYQNNDYYYIKEDFLYT